MAPPGKATVPWKWIVVLCLLGFGWTGFWLYYESGRVRQPPVVDEKVELPADIERLCQRIEANHSGASQSLAMRLSRLNEKQRQAILERAVADGLKKGAASLYVNLMVQEREKTFALLKPHFSLSPKAIPALELFSELYVDVVHGWRKEAKKEHRQLIYRMLKMGLKEPMAEPQLSIRVVALGIIERTRDTAAIHLLRQMAQAEKAHPQRKERISRLLSKLESIKRNNLEQR